MQMPSETFQTASLKHQTFIFMQVIPITKITLCHCSVLNAENKTMPSEKVVSDCICASCARLRFVWTKLIAPTLATLERIVSLMASRVLYELCLGHQIDCAYLGVCLAPIQWLWQVLQFLR